MDRKNSDWDQAMPDQTIKRRLKALLMRTPVAASQILSVSSSLPLSTLAPSGEKEQEVTSRECPLSVHFSVPTKMSES